MLLLTHFERKGYNSELLQVIYPRINNEAQLQLDFSEALFEVLIARQRFQTAIDSKAFFYTNLLADLVTQNPFRIQFFQLKSAKFLPTDFSKITGVMIDTQSPFGLFLRMSVLGFTPAHYYQEKEAYMRFEERMRGEFAKERFGKDKIKFYENLQRQFYGKLSELYKLFMRK